MANFYMRGHNYQITTRSDQDTVKHVFTNGHCHSFAMALRSLTDWPLFGLFGPFDDDMPSHVVVQAPSGTLVDIEGPGVERRWHGREPRPITEEDVKAYIAARERGGIGYVPSNVTGAKPFARKVLKQVEVR